ncbi:hypothetical protein D3C87_1723290 [compost metagenome]
MWLAGTVGRDVLFIIGLPSGAIGQTQQVGINTDVQLPETHIDAGQKTEPVDRHIAVFQVILDSGNAFGLQIGPASIIAPCPETKPQPEPREFLWPNLLVIHHGRSPRIAAQA